MTKVFITRYALTQGIIEVEGEITDLGNLRHVDGGFTYRNDFKFTMDEAIEKAEDMRRRKVHNLKKKLAQLEGADFKKPNPFERKP